MTDAIQYDDKSEYLKKANVANNLTTTSEGYALDARQGKALSDGKINTSAIANNLTTTASGYVLDARQGKALNDKTVQRNSFSMNPGTYNLFNLSSNSSYLVYCTSNVSKGLWLVQTGISSGAVTQLITPTNISIQMAGLSSLILQYTNSTSYDLTGGIIKLGET